MSTTKHFAWLLLLMFLAGCAPQAPGSALVAAATAPAPVPASTITLPVSTTGPTSTAAVNPPTAATVAPSPISTVDSRLKACSPLAEVALSEIPELVSNPYHPPKPGYDDPHAGVDLALRLPDSQVAVSGRPVLSAFPGKVVMVTRDRFPFGNAVIVETILGPAGQEVPAAQEVPGGWLEQAGIPTPAPTPTVRSALTCPAALSPAAADPSRRSLYVLYAHLLEPPAWNLGDTLECGQSIGAVGGTGNALNPHLHFETRVGPSGIELPAMAHYDASATSEEMASYCTWTVSGIFQLADPLKVLAASAAQP